MKPTWTTGQIAKLIHVSSRTVTHWIDDGRLRGYRINSNGGNNRDHRRVPVANLLAFLRQNGLEHLVGQVTTNVLLFNLPAALVASLRLLLSEVDGYRLHVAEDGFEAGQLSSEYPPAVAVIALSGARQVGLNVARGLRRDAKPPRLVAVLAEDDEGCDEVRLLFDDWLQEPCGAAVVAERVKGIDH